MKFPNGGTSQSSGVELVRTAVGFVFQAQHKLVQKNTVVLKNELLKIKKIRFISLSSIQLQ